MLTKDLVYLIQQNDKIMKYIHHIVTTEERNITNVESIYTNSATTKSSMIMMVGILKGVQYEILNRDTNEIKIVKSN